jgi:hypothetical protein
LILSHLALKSKYGFSYYIEVKCKTKNTNSNYNNQKKKNWALSTAIRPLEIRTTHKSSYEFVRVTCANSHE